MATTPNEAPNDTTMRASLAPDLGAADDLSQDDQPWDGWDLDFAHAPEPGTPEWDAWLDDARMKHDSE